MKLYGREWTRREIEARVGRINQIGGLRRMRLAEGLEDGVEQIEVRTGSGLAGHISPHRCLDLSFVEVDGHAISWQGHSGDVHPAYFPSAEPTSWLRTCAGGLLMTCGFLNAGPPVEENGEGLAFHGRAHHIPATQVAAFGEWQGDEYIMTIRGEVREARLFGENIRLIRIWKTKLGSGLIELEDVYENCAYQPSPLMVLYHFNFGFPLMAPGLEMHWPSKTVKPRDEKAPYDEYDKWREPDADIFERVYFHEDLVEETRADGSHWAEAKLVQPKFPGPGEKTQKLEVALRWDRKNLPCLTEWNMPGCTAHVLGIEPGNCLPMGRPEERKSGHLRILEPGESIVHRLELEINR